MRAVEGDVMFVRHFAKCCLVMVLTGVAASAVLATDATYDPLNIPKDQLTEPIDTVVQDKSRSRDIPIRIYLPAQESPAPVVLFSHGLGGTRQGNAYCGKHWAARGYVVVFLQHADSDDSVWRKKRL